MSDKSVITINTSAQPAGLRVDSHTIGLVVVNKPGMLMRICQVFARRGFNIDSLVVSPDLESRYSQMIITAQGNAQDLDQIIKQVSKLIDVIHASECRSDGAVERELALVKVKATADHRTEILQIIAHFEGKTVDFSEKSLIIQLAGSTEKLNAAVAMLGRFGLLEVVRTGKVVMKRGRD